ncbi:hypothetical protein P5V15_015273 [Pogonomyrmex californicus]
MYTGTQDDTKCFCHCQSPDIFAYHLMKGPGYMALLAGSNSHRKVRTHRKIESHDTNFLTRECLEVKILQVESPLLFWVQLKNGEAALEKLHQELHQRMIIKQDQLRYLSDVKQDDIVAVKERNAWRRGLVIAVLLNTQIVKIAIREGELFTRGTQIYISWRYISQTTVASSYLRANSSVSPHSL